MKRLFSASRFGRALLVAEVLTLSIQTNGETVQELYDAAKTNDPVLRAAEANYYARSEMLPQSRATLLPNISLQGSTSENQRDSSRSIEETFINKNWSAQLRQPIFNAQRWFTYRGAKALKSQAEYDFAASEQNLIVRVVGAYLNVLRAQALVEATQAEEEAVKRQLEQVQLRFDVGLVEKTPVLEATAAYDASVVRRIQAEGDHDVLFETLQTMTGIEHKEIDLLDASLPIINPDPMDEREWVASALGTNLSVLGAREALTASERDLRAKLSGHLPTIDAIVSHSHFATEGMSFLGSKTDTQVYSLQAQIPVFQGGLIRSRVKESRHRLEQARQNLIERERTVTRDTRNFFRTVATDVIRVKARIRAIKSSELALEATQAGYEVGTRNIVDVLQAQQRLFVSQFDYADSRYKYVLDLMQLKQSAGTLDHSDIKQLSTYSNSRNPVVRIDKIKSRSS